MSKHPWMDYRNWAVIGASENTHSYGYRISKELLDSGYSVIPVTPSYDEILGMPAFGRLTDYDGEIDVVDFVVNPSIGIRVLDDVIAKGVKKIMLQPGTASKDLIEKAEAAGIEVLESCVLVLLSWK